MRQPAVRLLHAGVRPDDAPAARGAPRARRRQHPALSFGQPVPLRGLPADHRGGEARGAENEADMRQLIWLAFLLFVASSEAQEYPSKPIRILVPFAPGGAVDTSTRILTQKMNERLGWNFVVENRPGGNGFIATTVVQKSAPDGYTLLMAHTGEFAVNPALFENVPYELERDFVPITMVSDAPMLYLANSAAPFNSFQELVAVAKAKPGTITFSSAGSGSINHLAAEGHAAGDYRPHQRGSASDTQLAGGAEALRRERRRRGSLDDAGRVPGAHQERCRALQARGAEGRRQAGVRIRGRSPNSSDAQLSELGLRPRIFSLRRTPSPCRARTWRAGCGARCPAG